MVLLAPSGRRDPDHSSFLKNSLGRFRDSDLLRLVFERMVGICLAAGMVKGDGFAIDASVIQADASRYHGLEPEKIDWSSLERPTRAVREYLDALDVAEEPEPGRKPRGNLAIRPGVSLHGQGQRARSVWLRPDDPIDNEHAIIVDVEPMLARTFDEVRATATMMERTKARFGIEAGEARR